MKALVAVLIVVLVIVFGGAIGLALEYVSVQNKANSYESNITKYNDDSKNVLSNYTLKIQEQVQIPAMYATDLQNTLKAYFQNDNKNVQVTSGMTTMLKQAIPNLDASMYKDLMITINAGRDEFRDAQRRKIDACTEYTRFRGEFFTSMMLSAKYPGSTIADQCKVISDQRTDTAFKTGQQEVIKLR